MLWIEYELCHRLMQPSVDKVLIMYAPWPFLMKLKMLLFA